MYHVYVLKSLRDGHFYTGFANLIEERVQQHNSGLVQSTKNRVPFELVYSESCINKTDALHREIYLKTSWGKRYIKNRIKNFLKKNLSSFAYSESATVR